MDSSKFPDVPNVETNPISSDCQEFIMDKYRTMVPAGETPSELSLVFAILRDGMILPFSALDANGHPVAKEYSLPVDLGQIFHANQIAIVSAETTPNVIRASGWYIQAGKHRCNGG